MNARTKFPSHRIIADSIKAIEAEADHDKRRALIARADLRLRNTMVGATAAEFPELQRFARIIERHWDAVVKQGYDRLTA